MKPRRIRFEGRKVIEIYIFSPASRIRFMAFESCPNGYPSSCNSR
jgi:hypothetical protein